MNQSFYRHLNYFWKCFLLTFYSNVLYYYTIISNMINSLGRQRKRDVQDSCESGGNIYNSFFLNRISIVTLVAILSLLPCLPEARTLSNIKDADNMGEIEIKKLHKDFEKLIRMKWEEIAKKVSFMSPEKAKETLKTLSRVNDDAADLLNYEIEEQIDTGKDLTEEQKKILFGLLSTYPISSKEKYTNILKKEGGLTKDDFKTLKQFYIDLCKSIGTNAIKYGNLYNLLLLDHILLQKHNQINEFVTDWNEYVDTLDNDEE